MARSAVTSGSGGHKVALSLSPTSGAHAVRFSFLQKKKIKLYDDSQDIEKQGLSVVRSGVCSIFCGSHRATAVFQGVCRL